MAYSKNPEVAPLFEADAEQPADVYRAWIAYDFERDRFRGVLERMSWNKPLTSRGDYTTKRVEVVSDELALGAMMQLDRAALRIGQLPMWHGDVATFRTMSPDERESCARAYGGKL